jgi:hypothetical protein
VAVAFCAGSQARVAAASDLSWSGPPECRQSEQLSFQVERALGAPLAQTGSVHLQVHIERVTPDARALLRIASAETGAQSVDLKERLLVAPDCSTLVDTLAVAIALAVEAAAPQPRAELATRTPPSPSPGPARAEPANLTLQVSDAPLAAPERTRGPDLLPSASAQLVGDSGSLPAPALGLAVGVRLAGASWQIEALGTLWLEQHPSLRGTGVAGAGADMNLATGALLGCAKPFGSVGALSVALCLGWEMGRLSGSGTGVNRPRDANALWLAPSLQAELFYRWPGTRLGLGARVGGAMPLGRDEFVLEGLGSVHQPASLAARASLAVDVAFE